MQENRPIAFASKSLTQAEIGYAQIEKELLAILFGCKRFHQYTYGRRVTVHSDHKPISAIMRKPISAAPPRLSRMLLQLQKYSIDVIHKSGKDIPVSDFLSRSSLPDTFENLSAGLDLHVHAVLQQLFVTDKRLEAVQQAILQDRQMQALQNMIVQGWPETRSACEQSVLEYWNHRDELSIEEGLIFRGQKIVISKIATCRNAETSSHRPFGCDKNVRARERQHILARHDKRNPGLRVALRGMSHS